ncbi:sigma-70 region 4 domain-containing protein [Luteimonas aquatica]|uniref:sigma-70 region 4 domain-containing protein n=1 Tax=Luteimonas aquatica TaxID=450364 RepID=UPI001F5AAFCA|nr:sigma-70 region 4 domain-containing protein [Luteimonas aquatica]
MISRTPKAPAPPPAALTAFLRGAERRGAVFAQLQAGNVDTGERALASAMRAFRFAAADQAVADWPRQFWALLLATPELREPPSTPHWDGDFAFFSRIGSGPRAALLLRLVAGLSETDAAGVLGVARPTYRLALQRALPHQADGRPDPTAWRLLGDAAQRAVRELPPERLAHLARLREAALLGRRLDPLPEPESETGPSPSSDAAVRPRWVWPAMIAVAALCLAAFLATFFLPGAGLPDDPNAPRVQVAALPPAQAPAETFDAQGALLTHPDFEQIFEDMPPAADGEAALARAARGDPGFYAWLAAGAPEPRMAPVSAPDAVPESPQPPPPPANQAPETHSETEDALL